MAREEIRSRHMGYYFRLVARVLLCASYHRQDDTYHSLCYTSNWLEREIAVATAWATISDWQQGIFYMHHPTYHDLIPVMEHWLERELTQRVHHERTLYNGATSRSILRLDKYRKIRALIYLVVYYIIIHNVTDSYSLIKYNQ